MPQRAQVTSVEALDMFRAQLIVFIEKATAAVDDVLDDVARTRVWLQSDQRMHWEAQLRRRAKALETAQQELFSARLSTLSNATSDKQLALRRAKTACDEAREKLDLLKKWNRQFENDSAPLARQVDKLRSHLTTELRQAVALLARTVGTLDAYADRTTPAPAEAAPTRAHPEGIA